jgi:hypothetical protein
MNVPKTVGELKRLLKDVPDDYEVVLPDDVDDIEVSAPYTQNVYAYDRIADGVWLQGSPRFRTPPILNPDGSHKILRVLQHPGRVEFF